MSDGLLDIGAVAKHAGVPVSTLHVWERSGLIAPVARNGLRRQYTPDVLSRLAIIVLSQRSGFTLAEVGELLENGDRPERAAQLQQKLHELHERRAQLDIAIQTVEHTLRCPHQVQTECPTFLRILDTILPGGPVGGPISDPTHRAATLGR